jgi:hypothetical protein
MFNLSAKFDLLANKTGFYSDYGPKADDVKSRPHGFMPKGLIGTHMISAMTGCAHFRFDRLNEKYVSVRLAQQLVWGLV